MLRIYFAVATNFNITGFTDTHGFKDWQGPMLFSRTFQALKIRTENSKTVKDLWQPCKNLSTAKVKLGKVM